MHERFAVTNAIVQGGQCSGRRITRFHRRSSSVRGTAETNKNTCTKNNSESAKLKDKHIRTYTTKFGAGRSRKRYVGILIVRADIGGAQKIAVILHVIH